MSERAGHSGPGVTRRDAIRRGAVLGGTLVWAAPVMQTLSMSAAHAQGGSPPPDDDDFDGPSYVAMNVMCDGKAYFVKFEGDEQGGGFEDKPGKTPKCEHIFTPVGEKANGARLGMEGEAEGDCITIETGSCVVIKSAVKKGQECVLGPTGAGTLEFCS